MLQIEVIRELCKDETIVLTDHLITRMRQRQIKYEDIKKTIKSGQIIEQYPSDYPFPSCLINGDNLHIVVSVGMSIYISLLLIGHRMINGKMAVLKEKERIHEMRDLQS